MIMCMVSSHRIDATRYRRPANRLIRKRSKIVGIEILMELRTRSRSARTVQRKNVRVD